MPRFAFTIGKVSPGVSPEVTVQQVTTAQTFIKGAILILASNKLSESGATPTTGIVGVAAQGAFTNPGNQLANNPTVITGGLVNYISVFVNNRTNTFVGRLVNGGTDPVTPALTDIRAYGVIKTADGTWAVNQADTTNLAVNVIGIQPLGGTAVLPWVFFRFINPSPLGN